MTDDLTPRTKREAMLMRAAYVRGMMDQVNREIRCEQRLYPDPLTDAPEPTLTEAEARERERAVGHAIAERVGSMAWRLGDHDRDIVLALRVDITRWTWEDYPSPAPPEPKRAPSAGADPDELVALRERIALLEKAITTSLGGNAIRCEPHLVERVLTRALAGEPFNRKGDWE